VKTKEGPILLKKREGPKKVHQTQWIIAIHGKKAGKKLTRKREKRTMVDLLYQSFRWDRQKEVLKNVDYYDLYEVIRVLDRIRSSEGKKPNTQFLVLIS